MRALRRLFIKLVFLVVAVAGFATYASWDRATNFEEIAAEITDIKHVCYLKKVERGIGSKTTRTSKEGPCSVVASLNRTHPEYQDFDLVKVTTIKYRYRSPADGAYHYSSQREENRRETGVPLSRGDSIQILAHKTDPEVTRKH